MEDRYEKEVATVKPKLFIAKKSGLKEIFHQNYNPK